MLIACPVPGKAKSAMLCQSFIAGAPRNAEGTVWYGVKAGNYGAWKAARSSGKDWYFIDNSYFNSVRGAQFRVTKNRLQHDGRGESNGSRFARLGEKIKPWRGCDTRGHAVFVEQSPDHMQYTLMGKGDEWINGALPQFMFDTNFRVRHWSADKLKIQTTLADDLHGARVLITHTSAAAVMACLAGVETQCAPECAALDVNESTDRLRWANALADQQWTIEELKGGMAWRTLNP